MCVGVWGMCCPSHTKNEISCSVGAVALLNVCAVWPCGFCVLIASGGQATPALLRIGVPEEILRDINV